MQFPFCFDIIHIPTFREITTKKGEIPLVYLLFFRCAEYGECTTFFMHQLWKKLNEMQKQKKSVGCIETKEKKNLKAPLDLEKADGENKWYSSNLNSVRFFFFFFFCCIGYLNSRTHTRQLNYGKFSPTPIFLPFLLIQTGAKSCLLQTWKCLKAPCAS